MKRTTTPPRSGCFAKLLLILILALIGLVLWHHGILDTFRQKQTTGLDEHPHMNEVWAYGSGEVKAVLIPLYGMITLNEQAGFWGPQPGSTGMALRSIRRATADPDVQAILLDIDSGGGGITASDVLYEQLRRFRASAPGRRILVLCGDITASGAYYAALPADHIMAHPTTITGSIGVIMQTLNIKELAEKLGIQDVTIKSGHSKDLLNPFQESSPENLAMLQGIVSSLHERFVSLVETHRPLTTTNRAAFAEGQVFTAQQAQTLGLIDSIGYWEDAVATTAAMLHEDEIKIYRYQEGFSMSQFFRALQTLNPLADLNRLRRHTGFLYRWTP